MVIHPVIRIISFLVLAAFVAFGGLNEILTGFLLVFVIMLIKRLQSMEVSLRIIKRMKWLFLSILVIYFWFTPGKSIIGNSVPYLPTIQGVQMGILRVLSLILIIFALNYFVSAIARNRLVEAIIWLLNPLSRIGFDCRALAIRIALVLELIPRVQQIVLDLKQTYKAESSVVINKEQLKWHHVVSSRITAISRMIELLFENVVSEALHMRSESISISLMSAPPLLQWSLPIAVLILFWGAKLI